MADLRPNVIDDAASAPADPGPDHRWFEWSGPVLRPRLCWPGGARLAVAIVLDLGAVEWERPEHPISVPPLGGRGRAPYPDFPRMSHREFGHRVGVFRLLELLDALGIVRAAAVDVLTAELYPRLIEHLQPRVGEFLAAGLSASRPITSRMSTDEECHYVRSTLERLELALGSRPMGWLGPQHSESARTPAVLAEAGLRYVADWGDDDQPYEMTGAGESLWSFPLSFELSDVSAMHLRLMGPARYAESLKEACQVLCAEGEVSGRALGIHLAPWVSGQAFRAAALEDALGHIASRSDVWSATPLEILDWCRGPR